MKIIESRKTKSRKSCLSNKGKLHKLYVFVSVDCQRWLHVVARKQMKDITKVKNVKGQRRELGAGKWEAE